MNQPPPAPSAVSSSVPLPRPASRQWILLAVVGVGLGAAGYNVYRQWPKSQEYDPKAIAFVDHARSNAPLGGLELDTLQFVDAEGQPVDLAKYRNQKNVVLVVTRGYTSNTIQGHYEGHFCVYCSTQTSRLIANYEAIAKHDAEVVVVFPIVAVEDSRYLVQFASLAEKSGGKTAPFPIVLDRELKAVNKLGIREDLAKPATYILDKQGQVRFAYVGKTIADRPSVASILEQLESFKSQAP